MSRTTSSLSIFQQIVPVLGAFLFQTIIPTSISFLCVAQTLPENVPLSNQTGVVGVWTWNATNPYSPLSDFRNEADRDYYTVWPEDIPGHSFRFPCQDRVSKLMLENFTYPESGGLIQTVQYFDLGIVEYFRPYWVKRKPCPQLWTWNKPLGWPPIYCERGDMTNLYVTRASRTLLQGMQNGAIMVFIQQAAFIVLAILIPVYCQNRSQGFHKMVPLTKQCLLSLNWMTTFVESLHLLFLAVVGYNLAEGYAHAGDWRAISLNSLAFYYRIQTACAFVASFLRQCAESIESQLLVQSGNNMQAQVGKKMKKKKKKRRLPVEIFIGQVVVYVVVVEYLYLTDDDYQNFLIQVVFGVATVAITLTMISVINTMASSLWSIIKAVWTFVRS